MGLWTKKAEKGFGQFIDDKLKLPFWAEPFDGLLASQAIGWLDGNYSSKMPESVKPVYVKIGQVFEQYSTDKGIKIEDLLGIEELAMFINSLVDIPGMTEEDEGILFQAILQGLFSVIKKFIENKKAAKLNTQAEV